MGGRIASNGSLAAKTNGVGCRTAIPACGLFLLIGAVRQLRGECGQRRVQGADLALSAQVTTIMGGSTTA